jgi:beta-glucosidase
VSGEDPYLGFILARPLVEGIQSNNVIANAKHWVNNNQETDRSGGNMVVDERTRFEMCVSHIPLAQLLPHRL